MVIELVNSWDIHYSMAFANFLFISFVIMLNPSLSKAGTVLERHPIVEIMSTPKCKNKTCDIKFKVKCVEECIGADSDYPGCDLEGKSFSVKIKKPEDVLKKGDLVMLYYTYGCSDSGSCSKPEWFYDKKDKCKTIESAHLPSPASNDKEFRILDLQKDSVWEKLGFKQDDVITDCLAVMTNAPVKKESCLSFFDDKTRSPDIQYVIIKYRRENKNHSKHIDFK